MEREESFCIRIQRIPYHPPHHPHSGWRWSPGRIQSAEGVVARPRSGSGCCRIEHLSFIDRVHEVDGRRVVIKFRILDEAKD